MFAAGLLGQSARHAGGAVSKPRGRHVKIRRDKDTARKVSDILTSLARLIRAVGVLVDALSKWFS